MKKRLKIYLCIFAILFAVFMTSCNNDAKEKSIPDDTPVALAIQAELAERGISFGMTEEEVRNAEKDINLVMDPDFTMVGTDYTLKTFYSEEPIEYAGHDAIISYTFLDDYLYAVSYDIEVNYSKSEMDSKPAYALFLELAFKYTDMLGNPQAAEIEDDSTLWMTYSNTWHDGDADSAENIGNYIIHIYANQSVPSSYIDDYSDSVVLAFRGPVKNIVT